MDLKFSTDQVDQYQIDIPVYQGPLDLLLQLIESAELDITTLALAQVTEQYLKRLEALQAEAPALVLVKDPSDIERLGETGKPDQGCRRIARP